MQIIAKHLMKYAKENIEKQNNIILGNKFKSVFQHKTFGTMMVFLFNGNNLSSNNIVLQTTFGHFY